MSNYGFKPKTTSYLAVDDCNKSCIHISERRRGCLRLNDGASQQTPIKLKKKEKQLQN